MATLLSSLNDLTASGATISVIGFVINLAIATGLGLVLRDLYIRYGAALTNRRTLAANFVMLILTTMFIITVVKSSLALSLGLVGALSIVRFRTAIKEPEELAYLFLSIAIGLGLGADQTLITLVGFLFIAAFIWIKGFFVRVPADTHVYLQINGQRNSGTVAKAVDVIREHARGAYLKRLEEGDSSYEALFVADFSHFEALVACREELAKLDPQMRFTVLDNRS